MTEENISTKPAKPKGTVPTPPGGTPTRKAESPLNSMGFGYDSTLANGPHEKDALHYREPEDNYSYQYCGACAFYSGNYCNALEEGVHILAKCDAYISMAHELELRWNQFYSRKNRLESEQQEFEASQKTDDDKSIELDDDKSIEFEVKFASIDEDKQIVYGIILEPDEIDAHGDTISMAEIEKAAHGYALTPMVIGEGHTKKAKAQSIETFVYNPEMLKEVKPGSWVMAVKVHSKKLWKGVQDGDYTGFSIGALLKRRPIKEEE